MCSATLTSGSRVALPGALRERLALEPGDRVEFILRADGTTSPRAKQREARDRSASLARPRLRRLTVRQMDDAIARHLLSRKH